MEEHTDGTLRLVKEGPLGGFANNVYLIQDVASGEAIVVDAPQDAERILASLGGGRVTAIVVTHRHPDHWVSIEALKQASGAPVLCHEADAQPYTGHVDGAVAEGQELAIGASRVRVIHTPGHTPGHVCLLAGRYLITGDALFPGGPGHTTRPEELQEAIRSITEKLFPLPDETEVHPGHGDGCALGQSKREYAVFAAKEHPADLCGDVTWES